MIWENETSRVRISRFCLNGGEKKEYIIIGLFFMAS